MEAFQGTSRRDSKGVLHHMMLYGVASRRTARGDPELAVDQSQVPVDRARTDDELLGYLGIGEPLGHETEHLHLTGGQSCWRGGMTCGSGRRGTRRCLGRRKSRRGLWREGLRRGEHL